MRYFALRMVVVLITLLVLFSSCALPSWIEQLPSQVEKVPSWIGQFISWIDEFNNQKPVAYIDLIKPKLANQGDTIIFTGHGIDRDGEIVAWMWRSDIDGDLSIEPSFESDILSVGEHFIYFKVQDNKGEWSVETQGIVQVLGANSDLPAIGDFSAYPTDIRSGDSTTVYWNVAGATAVNIEPVIGSVPLTGSRTVILDANTTFRLTAGNPAGTVSKTCMVNVAGGNASLTQYPVINYFNAGDMVIVAGEISSLSWSVSNAESVTIEPSIGLVSPEGYLEVCPSESIEYTLTAKNSAGSVTESVSIGVAMEDQFTITQVQSSGTIISERNKCPSTLSFSFLITGSGAGIVTYYIESSTGAVTPTENLVFSKAGTETINANMIVSAPGEYREILHIITPEKLTKNSQAVVVSCAETYGVTEAFCISGPLSGQRACPFTLFYTFGITADGPCIVFYHFERSDGSVLPYQTITFSEASGKTIEFSWIVDEPGTYWVELVITSPDDVTAVSEAMNLTCK